MQPSAFVNFASAIATGRDWGDVAKNCLDQLPPSPGANLGFLYVTDRLADQLGSIVTLFRGVTGIKHWVGTIGLGVLGSGQEIIDRPAVSVLIGKFPNDGFRLIPGLHDGLAPLEQSAGTWLALHPPMLSLIHGNPGAKSLTSVLSALERRLGFLVGGLTASRGDMASVADQVSQSTVSGVIFAESVPVATGHSQGCSLIGTPHCVTAADGNVVFELDDAPALDVFRRTVQWPTHRDLSRIAGEYFVALPIPGSDIGDYLVRPFIGVDPVKGWMALGEAREVGQSLQFARRDPAAAMADLERMLTQMKRRIGGVPQAGIYISCVARGPALFGDMAAEVGAIHRILGEFPLTGFAAGGEISAGRLYSHTGVLTLFL